MIHFSWSKRKKSSPSKWPVVLLPPQQVNKRIEFSFLQGLKASFRRLYNDAFLLVEPRIDIFARCNVNGSTFSSQFNRTDRGSTILSYCVDRDDQGVETISPYFGQVTFFFKARVHISDNGTIKRKTQLGICGLVSLCKPKAFFG